MITWQDVKIVRGITEGTIKVYFDDPEAPVMTATDKTFTWDQVGSFDDTGDFDYVKLNGVQVERPGN